MSAANTAFKVENGLYVVGDATVSNSLNVNLNLTVNNSLAVNTVNSSLIPVSNSFALGNSTSIFVNLFIANGSSEGTFTANVFNVSVANVSTSLIPNGNATPLGNTTRRWATYATLIDASGNANVAGTLGVGNTTVTGFANVSASLQVGTTANVAGTLGAGNTTITGSANVTTTLQVAGVATFGNNVNVAGTLTANSLTLGGNFAVTTAGVATINSFASNSTFATLTFQSNNTLFYQNVAFDTDLLFIDAVNNRIGIANGAPSAADLVTIGSGNVVFGITNTALRFLGANSSQNSYIGTFANTSNSRFVFATFDTSNSTSQHGGFAFYGVANSTNTYSLMSLNNYELTYKSGNVAHAGNFGIYNVSGTRVGP